ncbi:hypothetical protein FOL46_000182, partial [Perkinsus olseni]
NALEATEEYHSQPARRRYFTFTDFYRPGGPLFFYVGNEGPVEIYVNHTGLMWELGSDLGALLVFAEHRYYGKTQAYPDGTPDCLRYLTIEQALADYSVLIDHLFDEYALPASTATIAFGGSYGGMLASAFRYKYPHIVDGAIAASAPIFAIGGVTPDPSKASFNEIITRDAGPVCAKRFRDTLKLVYKLSETEEGRDLLRANLRWCNDSVLANSTSLADDIVEWASAPWGYLAMGNFPYPSNYITAAMNVGGGADLPAHPVRVACEPFERLENLHGSDEGTDKDMFWPPRLFDPVQYKGECTEKYGVRSDSWAGLQFLRNMADAVASMSNVVFSNGKVDPWGVSIPDEEVPQGVDCRVMPCPESVTSFVMETGAHHSDLMFAREEVNQYTILCNIGGPFRTLMM